MPSRLGMDLLLALRRLPLQGEGQTTIHLPAPLPNLRLGLGVAPGVVRLRVVSKSPVLSWRMLWEGRGRRLSRLSCL